MMLIFSGFENPSASAFDELFTDVDQCKTMFRIVVKSNLTRTLAEDLMGKLVQVLSVLDELDAGYESLRSKISGLETSKEEIDVPMPLRASLKVGDRRLAMKNAQASSFWGTSYKSSKSTIVTQHIC